MKLKNDAVSLFSNKTEGSTSLLLKLNRLIRDNIKDEEYILLLIKESRIWLKSFAVIMNYLDRLEKDISNKRLFEAIINNMNESERNVVLRIFENSRKYFKNVSKILTISNSKTVPSFLTQLHNTNKKLKVIIAESRPKNEGRLLAKRLIGEGICVEYVTDFSIANYIPGIDAAIIGADKILANGNVVNKTGSKTLAVLCRRFKKPFYVIASKSKLVSEINYIPEGRDPSEVWKYSDNNLTIRNYYFEEVEKNLITKIITD